MIKRKVKRKIDQYEKKLNNLQVIKDIKNENEIKIRQHLTQLYNDLYYIDHYPKDVKYISLFGDTADDKRDQIRQQILNEKKKKKINKK